MITLVIFTCSGKEHLLEDTIRSFREKCAYAFTKTILAVDGQIDFSIIQSVNADVLVQNTGRKGYIFNILNALKHIETPYFFWLEDDFKFQQSINFSSLLDNLTKNTNWCEIILSRTAPLSEFEKEQHLYDDFYEMKSGFSASPVLCRTALIKEGFDAILKTEKKDETRYIGFENFLTEYFISINALCVLQDPGKIPHVSHVGLLESTAREFHMINSLDEKLSDVGKEYISGFGSDRVIGLKSKIAIIPKLTWSSFKLLISVFKGRKYYDMAFRTHLAIVNFLKQN